MKRESNGWWPPKNKTAFWEFSCCVFSSAHAVIFICAKAGEMDSHCFFFLAGQIELTLRYTVMIKCSLCVLNSVHVIFLFGSVCVHAMLSVPQNFE